MPASIQTCITELSTHGILRFSGPDAKTFLQGQITINVNELNPMSSYLAAHCNLKGRMHALFRIFLSENENQIHYYLVLPTSMISSTLQAFKKYALFSKVQIDDLSSQSRGIGISGSDAAKILTDRLAENLGATLHGVCDISGLQSRYEIYGPNEQIAALEKEVSQLITKKSPDFWELLDIQEGLPCIYPQTQDQLLPHHVNLVELKGISFDKGCYLGQEIIARMHYRGNIKKHMYHAFLHDASQAPVPGDLVFIAGASLSEAPGMVVRAAPSDNGYELLVVIEDQYADFEKVHLYAVDGPKLFAT